MNPSWLLIILVLALQHRKCVYAQSTFQNLDFEQANVSGYAPNCSGIPVSSALPGWNAYFGSSQFTQMSYDEISTGAALISVVDTNVSFAYFGPIQGKYSAYLFGGGSSPLYSVSISQTGIIPATSHSILFEGNVFGAAFNVTLNGQLINIVPLQTFSAYTLYGGDISGFAGQTENLTFTEPPPTSGSQPSMFKLDNIQFSTSLIPEPATGALIFAGIGVLALGRKLSK